MKIVIDGIVIEQFDKDTITTQSKLKKALKRFEEKKSHILLGTQMFESKGTTTSNITLRRQSWGIRLSLFSGHIQ